MKNIIKISCLFFIILFLNGCESISLLKVDAPKKLLSEETNLITGSGPVVGYIDELGIHKWLGIPYAEPPTIDLRWKAPREINSWESIKEANSFSDPCVQFQSSLTADGLVKAGDIVGSEDCLYLNIYAPSPKKGVKNNNNNKLLPVMVWIHGGGNTTGMPSEYHPEVFVQSEDIIFISISYRLGFFGWLSHPLIRQQDGFDATSNFGLLDQIMALKWINKNIEFFGGNPNNVTIFGESAGGQNVIALYSSSLAKGLFNKAISQSGGTSTTSIKDAEKINRGDMSLQNNYKYNHVTTEEWIDVLYRKGLIRSTFNGITVLSELMSLSPAQLMSGIDKGEFWSKQRDLARMIGDDIVISKKGILDNLADINKHADVPIIFGINKDENKLFNFFNKEYVSNFFNIFFRVKDAFYYDILSDYQSLAWRSNGLDTPADLVLNSGQDNVFSYRFDWDEEPKVFGMDFSLLLGAAHAFEIPFIMGDFNFGDQTSFLYDKKRLIERDKLSLSMMSYWAEFARSGQPSTINNTHLPVWENWKMKGQNSSRIMILDTLSSGGPRMSNSYAPIKHLVEIFDKDPRSKMVADKCKFLNIAYAWVDDWKEKTNSCLGD